ncbi:hypothetical protein CEXT_459491 [Caerostris extrusa]|uniref:Uncharacterized protein n=1 Tax=Caerostris extrusa TaxID=172846 RepID=A0AAV4PY48_CAEEX|nr:hypothetical protein CEXT_459491 [Caerostris extrusa]
MKLMMLTLASSQEIYLGGESEVKCLLVGEYLLSAIGILLNKDANIKIITLAGTVIQMSAIILISTVKFKIKRKKYCRLLELDSARMEQLKINRFRSSK